MKNKLKELEEKLSPLVAECDCQLIGLEYGVVDEETTLTVLIGKSGGVSFDDCEKVTNKIDEVVDAFDISSGEPYNLSVSSFGLTRQLKNTKEFLYRMNEELEIKLFAPQDKKKVFIGVLNFVDDDKITLNIKGTDKDFLRKNIASAKLKLDF